DPVATTALWWIRKVRQGRHGGRELGPELYYEVRYESLVADPARECPKLFAFLDLPYDEVMVHSYEGRFAEEKTLAPDLVGRFEAVAGDLLDELDYARAAILPDAAALQRVAGIKERFIHASEARKLSPQALEKRRKEIDKANPFVFIVGCP